MDKPWQLRCRHGRSARARRLAILPEGDPQAGVTGKQRSEVLVAIGRDRRALDLERKLYQVRVLTSPS